MEHRIINGDSFELIKSLEDNSVDLVITSPPYADIINYGEKVSIMKPNEYVDWILSLFIEIHRVLKPSGSFILNINDKCVNGYKSTFIFDLISRNGNESPLKLYDYYIWHKKSGIPNGSPKRFRNNTEWIFHFCKDKTQLKFYMDRVLEEPAKGYLDRAMYDMSKSNHGVIENGIRIRDGVKDTTKNDKKNTTPEKVRPDNVFRFSTAGAARDNKIKHPAPYHKELPSYFINLLTDENDLVLDPFSGIGTTSLAAKELNRSSIGFELNERYADFSLERLNGLLETSFVINQYDLNDNFIESFNSPVEAAKKLNIISFHNILASYSRGNACSISHGFKWKIEPVKKTKYVINQYDLNNNFIKTFSSCSAAEKDTGISATDIMRCYSRKGFDTRGGFIWKLEKKID